jgi:hypothetical protein
VGGHPPKRVTALHDGGSKVSLGELDQIPPVAPRITPNHNAPIWLVARIAFKCHASRAQSGMIRLEIGGFKEKPNPATALRTYDRDLLIPDSAGQQNLGLRAHWGNAHPTLALAKVSILAAFETDTQKERKRFIIIGNKQGKMGNSAGHDSRFINPPSRQQQIWHRAKAVSQ